MENKKRCCGLNPNGCEDCTEYERLNPAEDSESYHRSQDMTSYPHPDILKSVQPTPSVSEKAWEEQIISNIWRRAYLDTKEEHVKILKDYGNEKVSDFKSSLRKQVEKRIAEFMNEGAESKADERKKYVKMHEWKRFLELIETTLPD